MSNYRYSPEFKDEAVRQIIEAGHSVSDVAARLGVSTNSLYNWVSAVQPSTTRPPMTITGRTGRRIEVSAIRIDVVRNGVAVDQPNQIGSHQYIIVLVQA